MDFYHYRVVVYTHCQHTFQFQQPVIVHVALNDPFKLTRCIQGEQTYILQRTTCIWQPSNNNISHKACTKSILNYSSYVYIVHAILPVSLHSPLTSVHHRGNQKVLSNCTLNQRWVDANENPVIQNKTPHCSQTLISAALDVLLCPLLAWLTTRRGTAS